MKKDQKGELFAVAQQIGKSLFLPIAVLPFAGILLGVGNSFTNATTIATYHLEGVLHPGTLLYSFMLLLNGAGNAVKDGAITTMLGIQTLQMGVFGGIVAGLCAAVLCNRFYKTKLPSSLSFFAGTRFVPIISMVAAVIVGVLSFFIWPVMQNGIFALGGLVQASGYFGTFIFGCIERALIPFGLHHIFYLPFWQTGLGGTAVIDGMTVQGAQNIFFAELASPNTVKFSVEATRFLTGKYPFMMAGLPGAAFAMYTTARPEKKKEAGSLLLSVALTTFLTGITEPIEFTFLFLAPMLFVIHVGFAGLAFVICHVLRICIGTTFSDGLIDFILYGVLPGQAKSNWMMMLPVFAAYFVLYFVVFRYFILKWDLKTPGREDDDEEMHLYSKAEYQAATGVGVAGGKQSLPADYDMKSAMILKGVGGSSNVKDIDCCATRLRLTLSDTEKVSKEILKSTGASGVVVKGNGIQVIYGPNVTIIKSDFEEFVVKVRKGTFEELTVNEQESNMQKDGETGKLSGIGQEDVKESTSFKSTVICSPISGRADVLENVPDEAFAAKMMGDGAIVIPEVSEVCAPEDGTVSLLFATKHAIGFTTDSGIELLIHVGIDTVKFEGRGFETLVEKGQHVRKGTPMLRLDLDYIKENAPSIATPVLCTELEDNQSIRLLAKGDIKAGEPLFAVVTNN